MFLNIFSLIVGFLCLFVAVLMLVNSKTNRQTNRYLVVILFIVGLQRFLNAIDALYAAKVAYSPLKANMSLAFYIVPIYYLFFYRLIYENKKVKKDALHFIFPTIIVFVNALEFEYRIGRYIFLIFSCCYFGFILLLVQELVNKKRLAMFEKDSYSTIRPWVFLMTAITFLLVVSSNYLLLSVAVSSINLNVFYTTSSFIWLLALLYMFKNPILIFGEQSFLKSLQKSAHQELLIWNANPLKRIEENDHIIYNAVKVRISSIILDIQVLQKSEAFLSTNCFKIATLAKELKIPKSHLELVFKYYCNYSISDFGNLLKVNYALSLIKEGYLDKYTVAHLGEKCLYKSRFTFAKNFKKFIGMSVSDYVKFHAKRKDSTARN